MKMGRYQQPNTPDAPHPSGSEECDRTLGTSAQSPMFLSREVAGAVDDALSGLEDFVKHTGDHSLPKIRLATLRRAFATLTTTLERQRAVVEAADDEYGFSPLMAADITALYGLNEDIAKRLDSWIVGIETALKEVE